MTKTKTVKKRNLAPDAKLTGLDYLGFCSGVATAIPGLIVSGFLLVYYTNVLQIAVTIPTTIMAVSKIFDGISDLIMGRIVDNCKSKYGHARPWYARMIIPTCICTFLIFWMPENIPEVAMYVYIFLTYNLCWTVCYTAMSVAHQTMIGAITINAKSRGVLGVVQMATNSVFTLLVVNFFLKICTAIGGGDPYSQFAFSMTLLIYLAFYILFAVLAFVFTRERAYNRVKDNEGVVDSSASDVTTEDSNVEHVEEEKVPFLTAAKSLVTNRYWVMCCVMCLGFFFIMAYSSSVTIYFAQYVLNDLDMQGTLSSMLFVMIIVGLLPAIFLMGKFGKKLPLLTGFVVAAIGWILPVFHMSSQVAFVGVCVAGIGFGLIAAPAGSFLQDTLTYGTWKTGVSAMGMGNSVNSFVNKLSTALGTFVLGVTLDMSGFDAALSAQPDSAIVAIKVLYMWVPAIICLACFAITLFYNLDKYLPQIAEDVKQGKIGDKRSDIGLK